MTTEDVPEPVEDAPLTPEEEQLDELVISGAALPATWGAPAALAQLLAGASQPVDADPPADLVASFRAATQAPAGDELAARRTRRGLVLGAVAGSNLLIGITAAAASVGVTAVAAYTGRLPGPLQSAAHAAIGAPARHSSHPSPSVTSAGPSARPAARPSHTAGRSAGASPAAGSPADLHGLCTAWAHGGLPPRSGGFVKLSGAAHGDSAIAGLCASLGIVAVAPSPSAGSTVTAPPSAAAATRTVGPSESGEPSEPGRPSGAGKPSKDAKASKSPKADEASPAASASPAPTETAAPTAAPSPSPTDDGKDKSPHPSKAPKSSKGGDD